MTTNHHLYFEPDDYFQGLIDDINTAQQEIVLETYIFKLDSIGNEIITALEAALQRGVRLRLLLDGVGSYYYSNRIAERLQSATSEVRVFHPLPWDFSVYRRALISGRWFSKVFYLLASINHRDHRKLCLVDQKIAWLGSFNITSDHANQASTVNNDHWHDTGIRVTGSVVASLVSNFNQVWSRKSGSISERSRQFLARAEITRRRQPRLKLLRELENCEDRIWITNAYFNPSRQILKTLTLKAKQGVSVKLIVPARSDIVFFPSLSRSFYTDLLNANIRVFEYRKRILHSKTMLIDQQLLIGSTNLNYRSLFHDMELDLLVNEPAQVEQMQERFFSDLDECVEIKPGNWREHSLFSRLLGGLARFLRYWF